MSATGSLGTNELCCHFLLRFAATRPWRCAWQEQLKTSTENVWSRLGARGIASRELARVTRLDGTCVRSLVHQVRCILRSLGRPPRLITSAAGAYFFLLSLARARARTESKNQFMWSRTSVRACMRDAASIANNALCHAALALL
jgi:hypothetical protein